MSAPKYIVDCIAELKIERAPLAAKLDAIDLALDNLQRIFGIHGEQPPLIERRRTPKADRQGDRHSEAVARREAILAAIAKSPRGLTVKDLRKLTPQLDSKARSNALTTLRVQGRIKRVRKLWVKAS